MHTVLDLKRKITGAIRSADINQTNSFEIAMSLAKDELLTLIKPISLVSESNIENGIFDDETRFEVPFDMNEDYVIGIKKCGKTCGCCDIWERKEDFDLSCNTKGKYNIAYVNSIKYLQIKKEDLITTCCTTDHVGDCLFPFTSLSGNGMWDGYGKIFNIHSDTTNYITNGGSLNFTLKGNAELVNNTAEVELDINSNIGLWIDLSDTRYLQSIEIQAGSDKDNYLTSTAIKAHNSEFRTGWQLVLFSDWKEIGNVDMENGRYWKIKFNTSDLGDCDNCNQFQVRLGCMSGRTFDCFKIKYYSNAIYKNPFTGERIIEIENDIENYHKYQIVLDEEAYLIYYHLVAEYLKMNTYENATASDYNYHRNKIESLVAKYKKKHSELVQTPSINAYPSKIISYGKLRK